MQEKAKRGIFSRRFFFVFKTNSNRFDCYSLKIHKIQKITAENSKFTELKPKLENKTQNGIRENPKNLLIVKRFFGFWSFKNRLLNQKVSVAIIFEFHGNSNTMGNSV